MQRYYFLLLLYNMTKLSVNINKIATIRNARGGTSPSVLEAAINCQNFGADGITIHPRSDERHITNKDVYDIKANPTFDNNENNTKSIDIFYIDLAICFLFQSIYCFFVGYKDPTRNIGDLPYYK